MKILLLQLVALSMVLFGGLAQAETRNRGFTVGQSINSEDIDELGELGANVVRMWCQPVTRATTESSSAFFERVQSCIERLQTLLPDYEANNIRVIFTIEPPSPLYDLSQRSTVQTVFQNSAIQSTFIEGWGMAAEAFAGEDQILGFDLLNEPAPPKKKNRAVYNYTELTTLLVQKIRAKGATQNIYIESEFGNPVKMSRVNSTCKALKKLGHTKLFASFHFYSPMTYSHQGIYGRPTGVALPSAKEFKKLAKTIKAAKNSSRCDGVYVGEFGASRDAPNRAEYFQQLVSIFENYGWDWTNHAYKEADVWSPEDSVERTNGSSTLDVLRAFFALNQ